MRKTVSIWNIMLLIVLTSVYSCEKKEEPYFLKVETNDGNTAPASLTVVAEGSTQSLVIKSNGSWKIVPSGSDNTWLSIHPDHGKGNGSFSITAEPNISLGKREVKLVCLVDGQEFSVLKIEQEGSGPNFSITPDSPSELPDIGGEIEFTISTTTDWDYSISNGDWLTEKSRTSTKLILEASGNAIKAGRLATVVFSLPGFQGLTKEVTVSQKGMSDAPLADLLDMIFKADGTAEDLSPRKHSISTFPGLAMSTVYSNTYKRYLARFNHTPGVNDITTGFYKVDYSSDQSFKDALSDGHALEAMFMLDIDSPIPNAEIKVFSSHQSGGTGIMLANSSKGNAITFLPNVGSGWTWTSSDIAPERGKFYHVIGVWNKQEGKSYIYVNGELKGTVNTSGNFNFPSATANWFGIGADPKNATAAEMGWKGDVVLARIYDKPLEGADVEKLWNKVKDLRPSLDDIQLSKISLPSKRVQLEHTYTIEGEGFSSGDKIRMKPVSGAGNEHVINSTVAGNSLSFKIPANFVTGRYRFFVVRGSKELDIGFATLTVVDDILNLTQVIAHRGYWVTGAPQNSVAALVKAQELDIYGAEFDVHITLDGVVVLNHDPTIEGIRIESVTYDKLKDITLKNGEKLPTLNDYLVQGKKDPTTKLILEIKTHSFSTAGKTNNDRASEAVVNMVKDFNMIDQVEYIAFSLDVCKKLLELQPNAIVAYLGGDRTPQDLHSLGIKGIDYNISVIRQNKAWISQAHNLGMTVNVWTVNSESDLREVINYGVDYITTDQPILAKQLIEEN